MMSSGGVASEQAAAERPVTLLLSGPGRRDPRRAVGRRARRAASALITFDMGGTSADIGIVTEDGIAEASARDTWIGGYPLLVPMLDVHTIGAGGGSIAYVDEGGAFRVGPRSAGADPGPACYGHGGEEPTITDAHVVLGRLDPERFLGGADDARPRRGRRGRRPARRASSGSPLAETAEGILTIANSNMARAIRSRTIEKGHDPREFALVAFGGAGPLHAAEVADSLGIPEVLVPPHPGITSAAGPADERPASTTRCARSSSCRARSTPTRLNRELDELEAELRGWLARDGVPDADDQRRSARSTAATSARATSCASRSTTARSPRPRSRSSTGCTSASTAAPTATRSRSSTRA